jgi:hypothetical protein
MKNNLDEYYQQKEEELREVAKKKKHKISGKSVFAIQKLIKKKK